ncbi:hypothetical protein PICMEDRAFT_107896 [Pichia membranifaciens NRRL Y-2026]|uniref:Uncharacterized protein n=1 Tax=Pichia membranifaciens NRRL Y-2026 TaxID=763406 RepID=A0A1E3NLY5_9ASCO|nr:hypothetical protein PICMEDRAFT_107896 [Pichia membranifaciens NRRL Y-2026]ODQ47149.1 hypothetical protein PICMEDRAFT_107896 [Pichia membranifaciens NRRL Y-2026]
MMEKKNRQDRWIEGWVCRSICGKSDKLGPEGGGILRDRQDETSPKTGEGKRNGPGGQRCLWRRSRNRPPVRGKVIRGSRATSRTRPVPPHPARYARSAPAGRQRAGGPTVEERGRRCRLQPRSRPERAGSRGPRANKTASGAGGGGLTRDPSSRRGARSAERTRQQRLRQQRREEAAGAVAAGAVAVVLAAAFLVLALQELGQAACFLAGAPALLCGGRAGGGAQAHAEGVQRRVPRRGGGAGRGRRRPQRVAEDRAHPAEQTLEHNRPLLAAVPGAARPPSRSGPWGGRRRPLEPPPTVLHAHTHVHPGHIHVAAAKAHVRVKPPALGVVQHRRRRPAPAQLDLHTRLQRARPELHTHVVARLLKLARQLRVVLLPERCASSIGAHHVAHRQVLAVHKA